MIKCEMMKAKKMRNKQKDSSHSINNQMLEENRIPMTNP